ncbi:MAG: class I SAM-dependent methyltransferase [Chloroflexota bacterium]
MDFLALKDIAERYMEVVNPTSPEKLLAAGQAAGLRPGQQVVDYGCGYGEMLALWAEHFGIGGLGLDLRPNACQRARQKMSERGLAGRIEIVCANGRDYPVRLGHYDVATCIGATFIWPDLPAALRALKEKIKPTGRLVIGEAYWRRSQAPPEYVRGESTILTEYEVLQTIRQGGFELNWVRHAGREEWDRYESGNWEGLLGWLAENPDHPERQDVLTHLRETQDEYTRYGREYFGWALYVLRPIID